ncbi:regulating synaptic membrane exocytosis protein 2 [Culicoides brevitarsis]|uniref:regulating synaptic membrane exocytosis protein 2 n=1 Tax=Culicoides brevitarsis TaxID=469753 RepID=UPI00307C24FE
MTDMPDLSHLTPEERAIIENVMQRQKQEEDRENEIMRRKQDEVTFLEDTIRQQQRRAGADLEATCHICLKTKFADGIGHVCHYCNIRCCARCGGKVTLRSNKVIWVCILCRKKQELLSKTGQWIGKQSSPVSFCRVGSDGKSILSPFDSSDKRPKLERTRSAAEKENLPLQHTSSMLRRQYSQQETPTCRRLSTTESSVEVNPSQRRMQPKLPQPPYHNHPQNDFNHQQTHHYSSSSQQHHYTRSLPYSGQSGSMRYEDDTDPRYYQGEIEGLMRSHPHLVHPMQQKYTSTQPNQMHDLIPKSRHRRHLISGGPYMPHQRSFSSSEEDIREYEVGHSLLYDNQALDTNHQQTEYRYPQQPLNNPGKLDVHQRNTYNRNIHNRYHSLNESSVISQVGQSSSTLLPQVVVCDVTTCTTNASPTLSNVDNNNQYSALHNLHNQINRYAQPSSTSISGTANVGGDSDSYWEESTDSRRFTERRKKTVRFDGQDSDDWTRWENERQGSQDSATKDSGIDTSSTFTSSEDSNRGDGPKHPVSWQVSSDGGRIIGHMILRKNLDGEDILGLKIVGGKSFPNGTRAAIVEKVKRGSIADQEGHIKAGDEVIEWNGQSLQNKSVQEVYDIIYDSKTDSQVELIVSRPLAILNRKIVQESWRQSHSPTRVQTQQRCRDSYDRSEKPSLLVTSPGSPDCQIKSNSASICGRYANRLTPGSIASQQSNIGGRIQIKLGFEISTLNVIITIICAADLTYRSNGDLRSPYATVFLLPDRSEKSKRRTKTIANTNDPRWGQTFLYSGLRRVDLNSRLLEISVWDYVRFGKNVFLGEVILELGNHPLDDEAEWYILQQYEMSQNNLARRDVDLSQSNEIEMISTPTDHLSPPSTLSRFSDSDTTSEVDFDGINTGRDGASISSIGSSTSPPPEVDLIERRSRRDVSPQGQRKLGGMVSKDYRTVSGVGQSYYNQSSTNRRSETMTQAHRSHSATPGDYYPRGSRRGSLSPPDNRYSEYPVLPIQPQTSSKSATVTPTGSPKKRQLPQVPHVASRSSAIFLHESDDRESNQRYSRQRARQQLSKQPTYRSTGMGGWERHYSGLSDSDLTSHTETSLRPRHSLSPDRDFLGEFADSDMESVVSVTSSAFSTQSERPRGSRVTRRVIKHRSLPLTRPRSVIPTENKNISKTRKILSEIASGQLSFTLPKTQSIYSISASMSENDNINSVPAMQIDCQIHNISGEKQLFLSEQCLFLREKPANRIMLPEIINSNSSDLSHENDIKFNENKLNSETDLICTSIPIEKVFTNFENIIIEPNDFATLRSAFSEQNLLQDMEVLTNLFGEKKVKSERTYQPNKFFFSDDNNMTKKDIIDDISTSKQYTKSHSTINLHEQNVRRRLPDIPKFKKLRPVTIHTSFVPIDYVDRSTKRLFKPLDIEKNSTDNQINKSVLKGLSAKCLNRDEIKLFTKRSRSLPAKIKTATDVLDSNRINEYDAPFSYMKNQSATCNMFNEEIRNALLTQTEIREKYGDSDKSDIKNINKVKTLREKKQKIEGKRHYEKSKKYMNIEYADDNVFLNCKENNEQRKNKKINNDNYYPKPKYNSDLYINNLFCHNRPASLHGDSIIDNKKHDYRRTSSLDGLNNFTNKLTHKTRHSSVSINDHPSIYEYIKSPSSPQKTCIHCANYKHANIASCIPSPQNGIALLSTSPKRTSLKKSNTTSSNCVVNSGAIKKTKRTISNSEYDERSRDKIKYREDQQHQKGSVRRRTDRDRQRDLERKREQEQLDGTMSSDQERGSSHQSTIDRSFSNNEGTPDDKIDGSLSDTAVGLQCLDSARRRHDQRSPKTATPTSERSIGISGMGKKSNSTSQLSATGRKRRLGFGKRGKTSFTVQRSEEVLPGEMRGGLSRGSSASSDGEGSELGDRWSPSLRITDSGQLSEFIDGLGPGQLVGRQVLGAPALGDIQLSMCRQKGFLEVEVIRARGLQSRPGSKVLPAPYVKVYLVQGKKCVAKAKTTTARKTLDPLYQQQLAFREPFDGCVLQVTVWGDYGRIEGKKVFMGVAQIMLDDLNLTNIVIGWYKLFGTTSLVSGTPTINLSRRSSITSFESLKLLN